MDIVFSVINIIILSITAILLWIYTKATQEMKSEMVKQTRLDQMPVMMMFVRNIGDNSKAPEDMQRLREKYLNFLIRIRTDGRESNYLLRLRNVGRGAAFNVMVESDKFDITDYETQFFAPQKDEHAIKVIQKGNRKVENWELFEESIFTIRCSDVLGSVYEFKYKIIDFKNRQIEYLGN